MISERLQPTHHKAGCAWTCASQWVSEVICKDESRFQWCEWPRPRSKYATPCSSAPSSAHVLLRGAKWGPLLWRHHSQFHICHLGSDRNTCCMHHLPRLPCDTKLDSVARMEKWNKMTQGKNLHSTKQGRENKYSELIVAPVFSGMGRRGDKECFWWSCGSFETSKNKPWGGGGAEITSESQMERKTSEIAVKIKRRVLLNASKLQVWRDQWGCQRLMPELWRERTRKEWKLQPLIVHTHSCKCNNLFVFCEWGIKTENWYIV